MRGIIEPMCEPDKLDLRHLITRRTCQLDNTKRIIYWKIRATKRFMEKAIMNTNRGQ